MRRTEDPALLVGGGRYVADIVLEDALHAVFVRSVEPHGEIRAIHADDARAAPGVVGVFTADNLGIQAVPPSLRPLAQTMVRSALARERV
ncbi:MAG: xanthine dehydrogenase family protein molybdopterin-binding subunit, partial [Acidimicrobiales bacterium]|nr:xanthine dehydrogenase family protein molybdopterin-binding subunit [Acidimicrobiales bacterium]